MREHHTSDELIWEGFIKRAVMMELMNQTSSML